MLRIKRHIFKEKNVQVIYFLETIFIEEAELPYATLFYGEGKNYDNTEDFYHDFATRTEALEDHATSYLNVIEDAEIEEIVSEEIIKHIDTFHATGGNLNLHPPV